MALKQYTQYILYIELARKVCWTFLANPIICLCVCVCVCVYLSIYLSLYMITWSTLCLIKVAKEWLISISINTWVGCSVTQSCPTFCSFMDCSKPGFPVLQHLLEPAQTHVHWVGDPIHTSHALLSTSPAFNLSQHQGLSYDSAFHIMWPRYWSFSFISPSNEYSGVIYFRIDWFDLLAV